MLTALLLAAVFFVAFTNGANANFKGVASLYGSGTATLRRAILWGTATTFAGSLAAAFLAQELVKKFSGRGIVPDSLIDDPSFLCAVGLGAALTSFLATRLGFPVSTTHALVGALLGAGLVGARSEVNFLAAGQLLATPLLVSPIIAAALGAAMYGVLRLARLAPDHRTPALDRLHYLSTGAASFARGLNDTPKMAALLVGMQGFGALQGIDSRIILLAVAIAIGGLIDARKVAETLGKKVTDMNPGQGFAASLSTAMLVIVASLYSLPVSTTHVSVGSLSGIGAATGQAHWKKIGEIALAWITTAPCGALFAALAYAALAYAGLSR